ncbi:hypothetical protein BH09BAC3_BH09BAC3_35170 [soil metagenome]
MKNRIVSVLAIVLLYACNNNESKDNVIGKYVNTYESEAKHYVVLEADSTFLHYYKKNNEAVKENKGNWKLLITPKKTEIVFRTWKTFGYGDSNDCNGCIRFVKLEKGEMIFDSDLPKEMNFKKEE